METTVEEPRPSAAPWRPRFNPWLIASSVMLGTFMEVLDATVVTVSLPHVGGSLAATAEESTWVLTSYLLSNAIVLPLTGWLGNRFGRKRVLMTCIVVFTAASALCGAATSLGVLVLARVLQGVGGGALQPMAQAILMESFPPARRGVAMAAFSMGVIVAPILGPTLGGWVTDNYSWRWVFYINLPIGLVALMLVNLFVEDPPYLQARRSGRIDYIGFGLMVIGLSALQIMLDRGQEADWFHASWVRWCAVIAVVTMLAFIVRELLIDEPIVDLRILGERNFAVGFGLSTVLGVCLYSTTSMLPLFLQTLLGYPAVDSGLAVSPRGIGAMFAAMVVGRLIALMDPRILVSAGLALLALSGYMFSGLTLSISKSSVVWASVLNGMSTGMIFVPLSLMTMGRLRIEQMGNAAGLYTLMRNLGGSIGIAVATTLLARSAQAHQAMLASHLTPYDPAYEQARQSLQKLLSAHTDPVTASQQAVGMLYKVLVQQATLLAFLDVFRAVSLLALLCVPLGFLFVRVRARRPGAPPPRGEGGATEPQKR